MALSPEDIAHHVHKAIKGLGTDDKALIATITAATNEQLAAAAGVYRSKHSHTMIEDIKGDTSGHYRDLLVGLVTPRYEYRAEVIHNAVAGLGTDEHSIIDVVAHISNAEIAAVAQWYEAKYKHSPKHDIKGDTSGNFKKALENLFELKRNEGLPYDPARVEADAHALHSKGEGRWGTDDNFFTNFFTTNPFPHLYAVNQVYTAKHGHDLRKACEKELSGYYAKLLAAMVTPRADYWAQRIHHAIAGAGTDDHVLIHAFVLNSKEEIALIGRAYAALYGKSILADVKGDTSGNYKKTIESLMHHAGL